MWLRLDNGDLMEVEGRVGMAELLRFDDPDQRDGVPTGRYQVLFNNRHAIQTTPTRAAAILDAIAACITQGRHLVDLRKVYDPADTPPSKPTIASRATEQTPAPVTEFGQVEYDVPDDYTGHLTDPIADIDG